MVQVLSIVPPILMKCYEIFSKISPDLASEIFSHLQEQEKPVYKAMIQNLVEPRRLRPIFIERKPRKDREAWLHQALSKKSADEIATQVFQIWLLGSHREMICQFLDRLGIKHDGKGIVEDLPPEPAQEALSAAIDALLEIRPPDVIAVYLHAFLAMEDTRWAKLSSILENDPRLALAHKDHPL
jgi:hypothetical protein